EADIPISISKAAKSCLGIAASAPKFPRWIRGTIVASPARRRERAPLPSRAWLRPRPSEDEVGCVQCGDLAGELDDLIGRSGMAEAEIERDARHVGAHVDMHRKLRRAARERRIVAGEREG